MSATRLIGRNRWRKAMRDEKVAIPFHDYAVMFGMRPKDFQAGIRKARTELGLPPTSSDMSRVHGRRVA